jgi:hypothetical protein
MLHFLKLKGKSKNERAFRHFRKIQKVYEYFK